MSSLPLPPRSLWNACSRLSCIPLLLGLLLGSTCSLQGEVPREKIRLLNLQGETTLAPLINWSPNGWELGEPASGEIPADQVLGVDWLARSMPPLHRQPQLLLVNGDRLAMVIEQWDEEAISGRTLLSTDRPLRIPLEYVRGAILRPLSDLSALAEALERINSHPPGNDLAMLANGDQVRGQLIQLEADSFPFERDSSKVPLARQQVVSICLNPQLSASPETITENSSLAVTLIDGSRVTISSWEKSTDRLTGKLQIGGIAVELPLSALASLRPQQPRVQSLTELEPTSFRFTPFLASSFQLKTDANPLGGPLLLNGHPNPTGLGLRSRSEVTYNLNRQYTGFVATFGIDDVAGNQGAAQCRILADGKLLFEIPSLRGGAPPVQTPLLNLAQVQQLTLIVDFGEEGDVLDLVNCIDPILVK